MPVHEGACGGCVWQFQERTCENNKGKDEGKAKGQGEGRGGERDKSKAKGETEQGKLCSWLSGQLVHVRLSNALLLAGLGSFQQVQVARFCCSGGIRLPGLEAYAATSIPHLLHH